MKRILLTAAISLSLAGAAFATPAGSQETAVETTGINAGDQTLISETTPSDEINTIEESPVGRKMTQAEKAHNAAVNDSWGVAITIIAMSIVIAALIVLSLLFLGFGKISEKLIQKRKRDTVKAKSAGLTDERHHEVDSGEAIAAIAAALAEHFGEGHDIEDTILTIRRMKRAYSPWNSKIYNLRILPELHRNPR